MKNKFNKLVDHASRNYPDFNENQARTQRQLLRQLRANKNEIILNEDQKAILSQSKELFDCLELSVY